MNRILALGLISIAFATTSCKNYGEAYHLPPEKMQAVIKDIQIAESYASIAGYDTALHIQVKNDDTLAKYYSIALKHHNITLEQFHQSLDWYRLHLTELDSIYVRAMKSIPENVSGKK
jgi:DNA polymerase III sliding clamp (beta) subunit (PCNA family)